MTETGQLADYVLPASTFLEETGIGGFPYGISYCEPYVMLRTMWNRSARASPSG